MLYEVITEDTERKDNAPPAERDCHTGLGQRRYHNPGRFFRAGKAER